MITDDKLMDQLAKAKLNPASEDAIEINRKFNPYLKMIAPMVPYSEAERNANLTKLYSLIYTFGLPTFWITISPDDAFSTLSIRLARTDLLGKLL